MILRMKKINNINNTNKIFKLSEKFKLKYAQDTSYNLLMARASYLLDLYQYTQGKDLGTGKALTIDQLNQIINELKTSSVNDEKFNQIEKMIKNNENIVKSIAKYL